MVNKKPNYVLIANSEPEIANLFAEMLLMDVEKYRFNIACTGKDCLAVLRRDVPDIVLMDIELPDTDGWELVKIIKELKPHMPIVIVTAKPPSMDDFSRIHMVSDYLMRPVTIDSLHIAVKEALEVPSLLETCIEAVRCLKDREENLSILEKKIMLLKQSISDRKFFVMMRQLYPGRMLKSDPNTRLMLESLRMRIDRAYSEIEEFKRGYLFA